MHGLHQTARAMRPLSYRGRDRCSASHGNRSAHYSESAARCQSSFAASVQNLREGKILVAIATKQRPATKQTLQPPTDKESHDLIPSDLLAQIEPRERREPLRRQSASSPR